MQSANGKIGIRKTTIVLSVVFVLLIICAASVFVFYQPLHSYYIMHRKYEIYGGMTDELKDSELFEDMQSGRSFCFLGDSITYGSLTEGIHWYQPLIPFIKGDISDYSHGGWTVSDLLEQTDFFPEAEIYIIAIGINDILFPDQEKSAHTAPEFAAKCTQLADSITERFPDAKIYFIAPWSYVDADISFVNRGDQFRSALEEWCKDTDYHCINPDQIIQSVLAAEDSDKYMCNDFHPNAPKGVGLFSYAVLKDAHNRLPDNDPE